MLCARDADYHVVRLKKKDVERTQLGGGKRARFRIGVLMEIIVIHY